MAVMQDGDFLAPDGIVIRPIPGAASPLMSVVVGIIPPRDAEYPVHFHHALEQVTYVLSGTVVVRQLGPAESQAAERELGPGDAITTPPATTISFSNAGPDPVEVLFICVPAYPATDADTEVLSGGHRPLTAQELRRSTERLRRAQEYLSGQIEARASMLRWLAQVDESDEHRA